MNSEKIDALFMNETRPDFTSYGNKTLQSFIRHYGLSGATKPRKDMLIIVNNLWSRMRAKVYYDELLEKLDDDEIEQDVLIELIHKIAELYPAQLGIPIQYKIPDGTDLYETLFFHAINADYLKVASELLKTGHSNPGFVAILEEDETETALIIILDTLLLLFCFDSSPSFDEKIKNAIKLATELIETGESNSGFVTGVGKSTALMQACRNKELLGLALLILNARETDLEQIDSSGYTALDYLIKHDLIENDVFHKIIKHFILEDPSDQHFQTKTAKRICESQQLKERVRNTLANDPDLQHLNIEDYCTDPLPSEATNVLQKAIPVTKANKPAKNAREKAVKILIAAATRVEPNHTHEQEPGEYIPKRLGGKPKRKSTKTKYVEKKKTRKAYRFT